MCDTPCPSPCRRATRQDFRLLLSAGDTEHLAPGAVARLVREAILSAVRHALTTA